MSRAIYTLVGPDGTEFDMEGPANATPEMIKEEAARLFPRFSAPRERPPVDQATEGLDPRDAQARRRPAPATDLWGALKEVYSIGGMRSALRGLADVPKGAVQLGARAINAVAPSVVPDSAVGGLDRAIQQDEDQFRWETGARPGQVDVARLAGRGVATMLATPARLLQGATTGARAIGAAGAGAISGAVEPVIDLQAGGTFAGEKAKQTLVGAAAGAVGVPIVETLVRVAVPAINAAANYVRRAARVFRPEQIDNVLAQELEKNGVQWRTLPEQVRNALREDYRNAINSGSITDPAALRRIADIRAVGATPTKGSASLDPVQVSVEKNLAKQGANSPDPVLQELARLEGENNAALIARAGRFGRTSDDAQATGERMIRGLKAEWERASARVRELYDQARSLHGGDIPLNTNGRASEVIAELEGTGKLPALGPVGAKILNTLNEGVELTIGRAEGMKTTLASEIRKATVAGDGNAVAALRRVYDVLESAEPATPLGKDAATAFRMARDANSKRMKMLESSPAMKEAVENDPASSRFFEKHVLSKAVEPADLARLRRLTTADPEVLDSLRGQVAEYLKRQALSGASDEVGTFSQSAYRKALDRIGDRKLAILFSPEEIAEMRQLARAASYLQVQPKGSAVNNSNTASTVVGTLDRIVSRVPMLGGMVRKFGQTMDAADMRQAAQSALLRPVPFRYPIVDDQTKNALLRRSVPIGLATGTAGTAALSN